MNKALVGISIVLVLVFGGRAVLQHLDRAAHANSASTRVDGFLGGMKDGGSFQVAFNMWKAGNMRAMNDMTQDQYNAVIDNLKTWLADGGIGPKVESYEIRDAEVVKEQQGLRGAEVKVSCMINGKFRTILAVRDEQLEWVD